MTPDSRLQLLIDIGSDRYSSRDELRWPSAEPRGWIDDVWQVYEAHFDGFTGSRLDPGFERFTHPASCWGRLQMDEGTTVVVAGTGPSLAAQADTLRRIRNRVLVFTSPRGAAALARVDVVPDLIVVEHASPLDADLSIEFASDSALPAEAWIAAELRTPAAVLGGAAADRLFVPHTWPGWGCWPATAVAMALGAGAGRVALLGIDLGTPASMAPEYEPAAALLGLLARTRLASCVDAGPCGAPKGGWRRAALAEIAGGPVATPLRVDTWSIGRRYFVDEAARWRERADDVLIRARQSLAMAIAVKDGADPSFARTAADTMLSWGDDPSLRNSLQDILGISYLPRLWRGGIDLRQPHRLWRPVVLGLHELLAQADRLDALLQPSEPRAVIHA